MLNLERKYLLSIQGTFQGKVSKELLVMTLALERLIDLNSIGTRVSRGARLYES